MNNKSKNINKSKKCGYGNKLKKHNKSKKRIYGNRLKKGGVMINSGGFGCVFKPALRCKGSKTRKENYISKLGTKKNMTEEYNNFQLIKKLLGKVPNSEKYFILNVSKCKPGKLSKNDMINLENCSVLERYSINNTSVNNYLNEFEILNIPYGGKDLWSLADNNSLPEYSIVLEKLVNLLKNAIMPMNKLNIYHFDIKANNILFKSISKSLKLIDYGLMGISKNKKIPEIILDRVIQFNTPFSCLLFNSLFVNDLLERLKVQNIKKNSNYKDIVNVVKNTYTDFLHKKNRFGHEGFLASVILPNINLSMIYENITELTFYSAVSNYISTILLKYLDFTLYKFNEKLYFNEVYSKNVDIYGWIMCFCIYFKDKNYTIKTIDNKVQSNVSKVIYKYCISPEYSAKPIPYNEVINSLR
tara:strand:- start:3890 stop:5134 length:1245 start_codon:yes stop_codon:yes gene_type:complete